jgi:hypothetical protein
MNRTTAFVAAATIIAAGIAGIGGMSHAAGQGSRQLAASTTPHQYKYKLPSTVGVQQATFAFPGLAPAIYNASFSINAITSPAGATLSCTFERPSGAFQLEQGGATFRASQSSVSVSGALDLRHAGPIRLLCFTKSPATFTLLNASYDSSVTFVQMGSTTVRPAAPSP